MSKKRIQSLQTLRHRDQWQRDEAMDHYQLCLQHAQQRHDEYQRRQEKSEQLADRLRAAYQQGGDVGQLMNLRAVLQGARDEAKGAEAALRQSEAHVQRAQQRLSEASAKLKATSKFEHKVRSHDQQERQKKAYREADALFIQRWGSKND